MFPLRLQAVPLPTPDEIKRELSALLAASGVLQPRRLHDSAGMPTGPLCEPMVVAPMSSAWSNLDFDADLTRFSPRNRAYIQRQITRTHWDSLHESPDAPSPWRLTTQHLPRLGDWAVAYDDTNPQARWCLVALEVPVFTIDRTRAVLRGQLNEPGYAEDFEHHLTHRSGQWICT